MLIFRPRRLVRRCARGNIERSAEKSLRPSFERAVTVFVPRKWSLEGVLSRIPLQITAFWIWSTAQRGSRRLLMITEGCDLEEDGN